MPRRVQWSRFSDAWQKLFGIQGNTELNVVDDCFLTLDAEQPVAEQMHLAYLRGWRPFSAGYTQAPVAGQYSSIRVTNPSVTNQLVVIEGFECFSTVGPMMIKVDNNVANLGGAGNMPSRDRRAGATVPNVGIGQGTNAAYLIPGPGLAWMIIGTTSVPKYFPVVLQPGLDFVIEAQTANQELRGTIWGMARELTQLET